MRCAIRASDDVHKADVLAEGSPWLLVVVLVTILGLD
jgi:hypothetical protein